MNQIDKDAEALAKLPPRPILVSELERLDIAVQIINRADRYLALAKAVRAFLRADGVNGGRRMKNRCWNPSMSVEDTKELAYWERNMLALKMANGWYRHGDPSYVGWSRVLSIDGGRITFHIPDDFDVGVLHEIEPNWDGHTTLEKWDRIAKKCGITLEAP